MKMEWLNYRTTPEEVAKVQEVLSRDAYRRFKQVNRADMAVVLARIYHMGMEDGAQQAIDQAQEGTDWEAIMDEIRAVKGVGAALAERIDGAVRGRFE